MISASSRQLLSFLAIAARAAIDVVAYDDTAEGLMPEADKSVRMTSIALRPRIAIGPVTDVKRVRTICEQAHHERYIANSLRTEIRVVPETVVRESAAV